MTKTYIKHLNIVAIPLIIQFITNYILGLTDQAIIGRISTEAYGAVGVINSFNFMLLGIVGSTAIIFNIRAGKRLGCNDVNAFRQEFVAAILLGLMIGLTISAAVFAGKSFVLRKIYGFKGEIFTEGIKFFTYICPYSLLQMQLFIFGQYYKIKRKTNWLLAGSLISSVLNIVLDFLFVLGGFGFPRFGASAAAASTILSMAVNLLILWYYSRFDIEVHLAKLPLYFSIAKQQMIDSIPLMGQEFFEGSVFVVVLNSIIARIGVIELSVYLILQQLIKFLLVPMNMYSSAALTLISQSRNDKQALKIFPRLASVLSLAMYLLIAAVLLIFRNQAAHIITDDLQVISKTSKILPLAVSCYLFQIPAVMYKNALFALEKSSYVLYSTAIVNTIILGAVSFLLVFGKIGLPEILGCQFFTFVVLFLLYRWKYYK
ncbi:MAG: MATE family efflux transporter [Lachnospiraceae bacterium]|nr:MATE family efflux transporter [Lachnospiraceae bacterium]